MTWLQGPRTISGVGIIVSEQFHDSIASVERFDDRLMKIVVAAKERVCFVTDAKVVPYETVAPQHRLLICTLKIAPPRLKQVERCGVPRIKWWRMKEKEAAVIPRVRLQTVTTVDDTWKKATNAIRQAAQLELGITKPGRRKVVKQA
ncbi:unnamed protein product [Heligmosomoides polygyrus]|uniref:Ribosomal_L28e domain-containing protein n=1 Tax=Heligmosomoides polygyrus TaxID=6339 RepID=A0A183G9M3_HELPZ|nr:unnamed protein product [Heligmosomoides polygyrus]